MSNIYPLAEGWQAVASQVNTFSVSNLPPRTDTLEFQILTNDSTIIKTSRLIAPQGEYLDSAVYTNVKMDSLPLSTQFLRVLVYCEGGPENGLIFHKELKIIPQKPLLLYKSNGISLTDSIGRFTEHNLVGQALLIDSVKHAEITNGPEGIYCFDLLRSAYSIETWLKFDLDKLETPYREACIMSIDSVWRLSLYSYGDQIWFQMRSLGVDVYHSLLYTAKLSRSDFSDSEWHHIAITASPTNNTTNMNFYFDGRKQEWTVFDTDNFNYIANSSYMSYAGTQNLFLGPTSFYPIDTLSTIITAMDEIRLWRKTLTQAEIENNLHKIILQEDFLVGYWNFDDLRNRLGYISDISYLNNTGQLKDGATFIPQYPFIQSQVDTIIYASSNTSVDTIIYQFIDHNLHTITADTCSIQDANHILLFDISSLPSKVDKLKISEYSSLSPHLPLVSEYLVEVLPPAPIATPKYNWNTFYHSADIGSFYNPIIVSGLPDNTTKVELGLEIGGNNYNIDQFVHSSIPYEYSLTLNGTDNYIETSQLISAPNEFTLSLWFNTTTINGGQIIGFTDSQKRTDKGNHDRELIMQEDGSLRFRLTTANSKTYVLYAENKYNDGQWHHIAVVLNDSIQLFADGSLVDANTSVVANSYPGYWIFGRISTVGKLFIEDKSISDYFQGSVCEINIINSAKNNDWLNANRYGLIDKEETTFHYRFNEGKNTIIHDYSGNNNGALMGSSKNWFLSNKLSHIVWNHNLIAIDTGTYTFFAKVYSMDGPENGESYQLGRIKNVSPFPEVYELPHIPFSYNMKNGFGYFNEGTELTNYLQFEIDYTYNDYINWENNFVKYYFYTHDGFLINHKTYTYTDDTANGELSIDMGDATPGSYLKVVVGYKDTNEQEYEFRYFSFPIYLNPMIAPIVSANFGPFNQAIAPGSMERLNTFVITTEILSDLNKVKAKFYTDDNIKVAEIDATQLNDTTWNLTYDMAKLSPPHSKLTIEYYLGQNTHPALVQGPFLITINSIRPKWFNFISDTGFHEVKQDGDTVTFSIDTPFEKESLINNSEDFEIPEWVPLLGGSSSSMKSPTAKAYLRYKIASDKLEMNEPPVFFQKIFNLGAGNATVLRVGFNYSQNNSYSIDAQKNLLATQNYSIGGKVTTGFKSLNEIADRVKNLVELANAADPLSLIIQPSFSLTFSGSYEYSSRLHLMMDPNTGKWGSFGNLYVDANINHEDAYRNSSSFKFYSGAIGAEFSIGAELLEGLAAGYFGVDARMVLGFGNSYITIPKNDSKILASLAFQIYGRFYITALWDWYEKTVWGPKLFYSTVWGDDLTNCFPPLDKNRSSVIKAKSSWSELADEIYPVRKFSKMAMPVPEPEITFSAEHHLFSWLEKGKSYGERKLQTRYLNRHNKTFSKVYTIDLNDNAINNLVSDAIDGDLTFFCWAQSRFDTKSILKVEKEDMLTEFIKAQDIWYAIYDREKDSIIVKKPINDDFRNMTSGRSEANPVITTISDSRIMIAWQVADLDMYQSELWYLLLEKSNGYWLANTPKAFHSVKGVATHLELVSIEDDEAVVTWLNTDKSDLIHNKIMTAFFDGTEWSSAQTLVDEVNTNYNYQSLNIQDGEGGLVVTAFVKDSLSRYEKILFKPWDKINKQWIDATVELISDSINHLQLPQIAINENGKILIAYKAEKLMIKTLANNISQVNLLMANANDPFANWEQIQASPFVCDTTKQLADLKISFIGNDTIILLANEYPMLPTNTAFEPTNGILFGNPNMNLVIRSFILDEQGVVQNVDENNFFTGIDNPSENLSKNKLYQNYPNPCNDRTTIAFDINESSMVKLELFDMNGNLLATLIQQSLEIGRYEINVNASLLKPGTYIYRLRTNNYTTSLRMMVGR